VHLIGESILVLKSFKFKEKVYLPIFPSRTNAIIESVIISSSEVLKHLSKIDPNKSQGPDGMHPLVFRNAASSLHVPITIIFKQSFDKGELPQAWLDANVTPFHKRALNSTRPTTAPFHSRQYWLKYSKN